MKRAVFVFILMLVSVCLFAQMDMLPQLLRDLPPELQEGLPVEMSYAEYRMLNRNVDFFTMFMSMFVPGYGLFHVEKPALASLIVGGRVAGYGLMTAALVRQWNDFKDLISLQALPDDAFTNVITNIALFSGGILLNGLGWAFDIIGAYHIANQEKDFVMYKYGLRKSLKEESEHYRMEYIRKIYLQDDRKVKRDLFLELSEFVNTYPNSEYAPEAEYYLAVILYRKHKNAEALVHVARGVYLYSHNRFTQPLRRLGVRIVEENRLWWKDDYEAMYKLTQLSERTVTSENREEVFLAFLKDFTKLTHPAFYTLISQEAYRFLHLFPDTKHGFMVHFYLGDFYERLKKWNKAVIEYVKCAGLYPESLLWEKAILRTATILDDRLCQEEYAEKYYNRLINRSPESPEAEQARKEMKERNNSETP